jgi:hypothetical protein
MIPVAITTWGTTHLPVFTLDPDGIETQRKSARHVPARIKARSLM